MESDTAQAGDSRGRSRGSHWLAFLWKRTIILLDIVLGIVVGGVLAFITFLVLTGAYITHVNGWTTLCGCGKPGNGIMFRAACARAYPGPINVPEEAAYWTTRVDNSGQKLSGQHDYVIHFPARQLPPNHAFWSLTMGDAHNRFVANPIGRYSVSDRSGLIPNADGSIDIYMQKTAPPDHESNWLPAPPGPFILWLRVYLPGPTILDGTYKVPPVVQTP